MTETITDPDKPWILVADDSRVVRRTIFKLMEGSYNIIEAIHGGAAWAQLLNDSRIEAVVTDIQMPEMDGYSLICRIRGADDPGLREIPIIVITSAEDDITRERAYACGANDFILKPFNAGQLLKCVRAQMKDFTEATESVAGKAATPKNGKQQVVVPTNSTGTIKDAVSHLDTGMKILANQATGAIAPHALVLVLRFLPLLKYCNIRFGLGMDKEIAEFQQKISAARARFDSEKTKGVA